MNGMLFDLGPEPTERELSPQCEHPATAQFLNRSLFGEYDLVCAECGATIAEDYREVEP